MEGEMCFYQIPTINKKDPIHEVNYYGELPESDEEYWMGINMHGEEGNNKSVIHNLANEVFVIDIIQCKVLA
jgi:hypothetical protein